MNSVSVEDNTGEVMDELDAAIFRALEKIGLKAEKHAKEYCPVKTGRLWNSITHAVDMGRQVAIIGTNVEYGPAIEFGHSKKAPQGYLRPAVFRHAEEYADIVRKELHF